MDARLAAGPDEDPSTLMMTISRSCRDATFAAGKQYETCLNTPPPLGIKDQESYCQCVGNQFAKMWQKSGDSPSAFLSVDIQTRAMMSCSDPDLARRLYGNN
jgi:hypothetical protein